jgi:hypothetical protein
MSARRSCLPTPNPTRYDHWWPRDGQGGHRPIPPLRALVPRVQAMVALLPVPATDEADERTRYRERSVLHPLQGLRAEGTQRGQEPRPPAGDHQGPCSGSGPEVGRLFRFHLDEPELSSPRSADASDALGRGPMSFVWAPIPKRAGYPDRASASAAPRPGLGTASRTQPWAHVRQLQRHQDQQARRRLARRTGRCPTQQREGSAADNHNHPRSCLATRSVRNLVSGQPA